MPKSNFRSSALIIRLAFALTLLAAALPAAASAPGGALAVDTPTATAQDPYPGPPTPTPAAYPGQDTPAATTSGQDTPTNAPAPATAATSVTAAPTLALASTAAPPTLPPAVTVTAAPTTPTAVYTPTIKATGVPRFEAGKCGDVTLPSGAREGRDISCGTLIVREEHADPSSPTIELAVAIVHTQAARAAPDPIVFNQGGPGFGSIDTYLPILLTSPFRGRRDLIVMDQRGTGHSNPALACPEVIDQTIKTLDQIQTAAEANAQFNAATLKCRDRLVHAGVNLSAYNTQESAADLEDLRVALGYRSLDLYGVSYGSLLVLDTLRFFPQTVRSAIIDGVVPPQGNMNTSVPFTEDRAFTELFKACAADAACNTTYPHLEDTFFNLVTELNLTPAKIRLIDPQTGQIYPAKLNGDGLIGAVFQAMYESDLVPALPEIIRRATTGDFAALEPALTAISLNRDWMIGMYWSVYCAEDADFNPASLNYSSVRPEFSKDQGVNNQAIKSLCQAWSVRDLSPVLNTPVTSTVPTLVLNGRFDPITPPANGVLAAQTLSNSTVITVPTTAHGAFPAGGKCISDIMGTFVDNPLLKVDQRCLATLPALTFASSSNLVNFSVVGVANDLVERKPSLLGSALAVALAVLALLSGLLLFPIAWALKLGSKPPADAAGLAGGVDPAAMFAAPPQADAGLLLTLAPWLAILAGLLPLAFGAAFIYTVGPMISANNGLLLLGLPGSLDWVFILPVVNAVIVLLLVLATLLGLISKDWSGRRKLYFLFLSLAGVVLVVALGLLGLLTALWGQAYAVVRGLVGS